MKPVDKMTREELIAEIKESLVDAWEDYPAGLIHDVISWMDGHNSHMPPRVSEMTDSEIREILREWRREEEETW